MKKISVFTLALCIIFSCIAVGCTKTPNPKPSTLPSVSPSATPSLAPSVSVTPTPTVAPSVNPTMSAPNPSTPPETNVVPNGTFNDNVMGIPQDWWGYNRDNAALVAPSNGRLRISADFGSVTLRTPITLQTGKTYTLSADIHVEKMQTGPFGDYFIGLGVSAMHEERAVKPENCIASLFYTAGIDVSNTQDFLAMTGYQNATFSVDTDGTYYVVFTSWLSTLDITVDNVFVTETSVTQPETERVRILISSDMHNTPDTHSWYGVGSNARLQQWVDGIKAEHQKDPIDALVILGDTSLDYWNFPPYGYYLTTGVSYTEDLITRYVSQHPKDFPIYYVPGNHEQYGNEKWVELTGQNREGYFTVGNNLFILSDTYGGYLDPTGHHDGVYTGVNMTNVLSAVNANPNANNIWLLAHEFQLNAENALFIQFLNSNQRVRGLFMGHT
ncbi:MAG: metallophosphoesterase, partial [Clostridia bacterium]|nr:metallophosphoesterase [Clostridia bacterium]